MTLRSRILAVLFAATAVFLLAACHHHDPVADPPSGVAVALDLPSVSLSVAGTHQFSATVTGAADNGVTWSVNNVAGGNATVGTIDNTGLYTAPATPPNPATVTVKATSVADPAVSGTCTVTIQAAATGTGLVSADNTGTVANNDSGFASISTDGRYVAFASYATNLVPGDVNSQRDIFVRDRQTGLVTLASVDNAGTQADDVTDRPSISGDGRYVAFESRAGNLTPGDTNANYDIFVRDLLAGTTTRVSVDNNGTMGNLASNLPTISRDGRYVAFVSYANNLVAGDTNNTFDIFVHDRQTATTIRVSVDNNGTEANDSSSLPSLSTDGRYVAFSSVATNLVAGDTNGYRDVFVHDRQTGTTTRVSVDNTGAQANADCDTPSISGDGRYVAFQSTATNLVAGDTNGTWDIFVHDRQTGTTTRVSVDNTGVEGNNNSIGASISADGRYVTFASDANNLVAGDTNGKRDVFVYDRTTGLIERASVDTAGAQGNNSSTFPKISGDGRFVAFESDATNLAAGDTNSRRDIFVRQLR
jgi:hypothetical protein